MGRDWGHSPAPASHLGVDLGRALGDHVDDLIAREVLVCVVLDDDLQAGVGALQGEHAVLELQDFFRCSERWLVLQALDLRRQTERRC